MPNFLWKAKELKQMHTTTQLNEIPNPNHPKPGDTIKVEPIRTVNAINNLKKFLAPSPRNSALFIVGINTAYRASELLSIRLGQVRHLRPGDRLEIKQKKTKKYRAVTMNKSCFDAIQKLLEHLDRKALQAKDLSWVDDDSYLFAGRQPDKPLSVPTLNNLVKDWCRKVNLR